MHKHAENSICHLYPDDPVGYCRNVLRVELTPEQQAVCEALMQPPHRVLIRSAHACGKTKLLACLASWFYDSFDPGITLVTAPTHHQVRDLLFKELRITRQDKRDFLPKATRVQSAPDHWIHGFTTQNANSFQGRHQERLFIIMDEAVGVDPTIWETAETMFGGDGHFWVCAYNPTDSASYAYQAEQSGKWRVVHMDATKHVNVQAQLRGEDPPIPGAITLPRLIDLFDTWATRLRDDEPPRPNDVVLQGRRYRPGAIAESRLLGKWPTEGVDGIWSPYIWDQLLAVRHEIQPQWPVVIGCDVGRYGDDHTVICVRKGFCFIRVESHVKQSTKFVANRLEHLCNHFMDKHNPQRRIPVLIDEGGIGGGVIDQADGHNFIPVNASCTPIDELRYSNVRAELWFTPRSMAAQGALDISRLPPAYLTRLKQELLVATYKVLPGSDKIQVSKKEDMKTLIGRSPDLADAFNLACYPVPKVVLG